MSEYSDQEIDLRPYIEAVLNKWYWVVGAGVVFALIGVGIGLLRTQTFEATALVAITEPSQRVQFDPRIQTNVENQPVAAYPELALSDELLDAVISRLPENYDLTLTSLRGKLTAESGGDGSILRLSVSDADPAQAAEMANIWAALFVDWANQVYSGQGGEQLSFFEEQLGEARIKLDNAEQELINFQAHNRAYILENELLALQQTQADFLAKQRQTELILQDLDSLLDQTGSGSNANETSVAQLASLLLQVRALGGVATSQESAMPWQIQINVDGQSNLSQEDQRAILSDLRSTLLAQTDQLDERLAELEPQILSVQQQKQEASAKEERLNRDFNVAEETYTTLSRTVDEKRITSQDTTSGIRLASRTAVPEFPTGPRKIFIAIGAGLIGAAIAVAVIVGLTWWRSSSFSTPASSNDVISREDDLAN
jgi:uncharacterized protein involved in exopolysaccharide biosynthesis